MARGDDVPPPLPVRLGVADAGELLTLQRAAYLGEARAHADLDLPPLVETLDAVRAVLAARDLDPAREDAADGVGAGEAGDGVGARAGVGAGAARDGVVEGERPAAEVWGLREGPDATGRLLGAVRLRAVPLGPPAADVAARQGGWRGREGAAGLPAIEVGRLVVVPDLQGHGLGSALLRHAHARAAATGHVASVLFTGEYSLANLRLYARHGYVETHRIPTPGGYDLVHLVRALSPDLGASRAE